MLRTALVALVLAVAAVAALGGLAPPAADDRPGPGTLVFNNEGEPETLDPGLMTGVSESRLAMALFEGLVTYDPATLAPLPGVAERWECSTDGRAWTFHLRSDARWSDGQPVTASDFISSWRRVLTPATGSDYASLLYPIAGAEDFHRGKGPWEQVGVAAPDARTLLVRLGGPCGWFLEVMAMSTAMPVRTELVERLGDRWTRPEHLIGNGPFRLASWEPRRAIAMERSPTYWDRGRVRLDRLVARAITDQESAYKSYLQGSIDLLSAVPPGKVEELRRNPDYRAAPYLGVYFYRLNCSRPPFDDARVRRAFALALDREPITRYVTRAGQIPTAAFCPPVAGYRGPPGLATDREAARRLLADAGYGPGGRPFPVVKLLFNSSEAHKQIAEAACEQWREALGVTVQLANQEWKVYLAAQDALDYDICRAAWIGDYNDPDTFLGLFASGDGNNRTGWADAAYDGLLRQARAEGDPVRRLDMYLRLERQLVEDALPVVPVYWYVNQALVRPSVRGWHENIRDIHPPKWLGISRSGSPSLGDGAAAEGRSADTMGEAHPPMLSPASQAKATPGKGREAGPQGRGGEAPEQEP